MSPKRCLNVHKNSLFTTTSSSSSSSSWICVIERREGTLAEIIVKKKKSKIKFHLCIPKGIILLWVQTAGWLLKHCVGEQIGLILDELPLTSRPAANVSPLPLIQRRAHRSLLYRFFACAPPFFFYYRLRSSPISPSLCSCMRLFVWVQFSLLSCCSMQIPLP